MFSKAQEEFIVLEPKDGILKIAVIARSSGRLHVLDIFFIPVLDQPPDAVSRLLRQFLRDRGVRTKKVILVMPRSSLIIRYLTLPSERPHEIREMLALGLHQYIPYEAHEVSFDFQVAESREDGFSKVILFCVLESVVSEQMAICEQAGLDVADVLCSTEASWKCVEDKEQGQGDVRLFVDMDARSTDIIAFSRHQIKFTRAIGTGARSRTEDMLSYKFVEQLLGEIKFSMDTFSKEFPTVVISEVILAGSEEYTQEIALALQNQLSAKVTPLDLKRLPMVWSRGSPMSAEFKEKGISFLSLVGAAQLSGETEMLSFLPGHRRVELSRKEAEKEMFFGGGMLLVASLSIALYFGVNLFWTGHRLKAVERKVSEIEAETRVAEEALEKLEIIGTNVRNKSIMLDMLRELHQRTPSGVKLTQLLLEEGDAVKIRGLAVKNHIVSEYLTKLEESELFNKVEFVFSQRKQVDRQEVFDFQITALLARRGI
ncbi:MAG: pilus assembly protein PilM [Candidatus Omnitrophica bacterium]|nr:pilus assembly protein PilM [Candidatus Omnitrophota bacterium]